MNTHPGWLLVGLGCVLLGGGLLWVFVPGLPLGRLPGDLRFGNGATRVYIPITTSILASLLLTAILWIVRMLAR